MGFTPTFGKQKGGSGWRGSGDAGKGQVPGAQLILTAPDEVAKLLVVGVVVMLDAEEHGSGDLHQRVIGRLLLLPTGVAVVEVVDFVSYLWKGSKDGINEEPEGANAEGAKPLAGLAGQECLVIPRAHPAAISMTQREEERRGLPAQGDAALFSQVGQASSSLSHQNKSNCTAMMLKHRKNITSLVTKRYLSQKYSTSSLWVSTRAAQRY